jgi:hypothetical protein
LTEKAELSKQTVGSAEGKVATEIAELRKSNSNKQKLLNEMEKRMEKIGKEHQKVLGRLDALEA